MKKENVDVEHCPYCKRHCSLNNPRCSKGKTLSKKKKEEKRKIESTLTKVSRMNIKRKKGDSKAIKEIKSVIQEEKYSEIDIRLSNLFQEGFDILQKQKGVKRTKKKKQFLTLSLLIEKGEMTQKELEGYTKNSIKDLNKHLLKMQKKGYINWKQGDVENNRISITESALLLWRTHQSDSKKDSLDFSVLENEEKEYLEKLLSKLYTNWRTK